MKSFLTLFAYLIVLTCTLASKQPSISAASRGSRTSARVVSDIIDIDAAHDDNDLALAGSGAGPADDTETGEDDVVDEEELSGDGDEIPDGSGTDGDIIPTPALTLCQERRQRVSGSSGRPLVGAYVPRCAADGSYELLQCHSSTGHCWCVDAAEGKEIPGSRRPAPQQPSCLATAAVRQPTAPITAQPTTTTTSELRRPTTTLRSERTRPSTSTRASTMRSSTTPQPAVSTSFGRVPTSSVDIVNKIDQIPNEPEIKFDGPPDTETNYVERPVVVSEPKSRRMSLRASVIGQPGILAAIIGAAVVVLLCLVLLVMFIVYRMHRKSQDPAIYYIDKSSRTPLAGAASANGPSVGFGSNRKPGGYMKAMDADVYG